MQGGVGGSTKTLQGQEVLEVGIFMRNCRPYVQHKTHTPTPGVPHACGASCK
jgi:hypothetical protein